MENKSVIYKITNVVNGKVYVGATTQGFRVRMLSHISKLKKQKHHNNRLQKDWNEFGEKKFIFEVLEECQKENLCCLERKYMTFYKSCNNELGYNLDFGGGKGKKLQKETIDKIRSYHFKKIVLVNTKEIFDSLNEASEKYGVGSNNISMCCNKKRNFAGRLENGDWMVWRYLEDYDENEEFCFKQLNRANNKKKIICLTTNEKFDTVNEAAEKFQVERRGISKVLNGWQKTCSSPTHGKLKFEFIK